ADWFSALKTGFADASESEIDWLENKALQHGWEGTAWHSSLKIEEDERLAQTVERLRNKLVPPFLAFAEALANAVGAPNQSQPTGAQLSQALRQLWSSLAAGQVLEKWSRSTPSQTPPPPDLHLTVWDQMHEWLDNLELAFEREALFLREWLPILELGLSSLTVGVVPPALDQVLIGAVDRSRNPELQLALVLGMNESVFPATPVKSSLLTEADRAALEGARIFLGPDTRHRLGHERFFG